MATSADIIIVGAGAAGCALAYRLSAKYSVLVLEAGANLTDDPLVTVPSNSAIITNYYNRFFSQLGHSTPNAEAVDPNLFPAMAGEILGGGSSVNGLQFVEGTAEYYDRWATAVQDSAWGSKNAKKVFNSIVNIENSDPSHPLDIQSVTWFESVAKLFAQSASIVAKIPYDIDYNDFDFPVGSFVRWQVTQTPESTRESSFTAYLKSILRPSREDPTIYVSRGTRNPITLVTQAKVQRIQFRSSSSHRAKATGVTAVVNGTCMEFRAKKKVIVTAGFQTASLLQLSGVGDAEILNSLGIASIINNRNVGRHIHNHLLIYLTGNVPVNGPNPFSPLPPDYNPQGLYIGGAQIPSATTGLRAYELFGSGVTPMEVGVTPTAYTIGGLVLDSKSTGEIQISSSDPNRPPEYDFKYFSDPVDIDSAIEMYTGMYNILVEMGLVPDGPDPVTDPDGTRKRVTTTPSQGFHWTGMTRMATSAADGVVDSRGKVFGSRNLYVADISVAPFNAAGNTQAVAYLVANIVADKMLKCRC